MDAAVFLDVQRAEEGLVEQPPGQRFGLQVGGMAVAGQVQAAPQVVAGPVVVGAAAGQSVLDAGHPACDAVLFGLQQIEGYRPGVVGVEQFLSFGGELVELCSELLMFGAAGRLSPGEVVEHEPLYAVTQLGVQGHAVVLAFDQLLDRFDQHGSAGAVGAFGVASGADEVRVDDTVAVAAVHDQQSASAGTAEHRAFEVVVVLPVDGAGLVVGAEPVLHLLPGGRIDKRRVDAGVARAAVADLALVVGVA